MKKEKIQKKLSVRPALLSGISEISINLEIIRIGHYTMSLPLLDRVALEVTCVAQTCKLYSGRVYNFSCIYLKKYYKSHNFIA